MSALARIWRVEPAASFDRAKAATMLSPLLSSVFEAARRIAQLSAADRELLQLRFEPRGVVGPRVDRRIEIGKVPAVLGALGRAGCSARPERSEQGHAANSGRNQGSTFQCSFQGSSFGFKNVEPWGPLPDSWNSTAVLARS